MPYVLLISAGTADVGSNDTVMSEEGENAEYCYISTLPDLPLGRGDKRGRNVRLMETALVLLHGVIPLAANGGVGSCG